MSEREALIAAICANPDDDTPRLVFADWLDENEPDARLLGKKSKRSPSAWASLIRAECELARLQADGSESAAVYEFFQENDEQTLEGVRWERIMPGVGRRVELTTTANKRRTTSTKARNKGLPRHVDSGAGWAIDTHRGFPGGVWMNNAEKFQKHIHILAPSCPPLRVTFSPYDALPAEIASCGVLRWCREAVVSCHHLELVRAMSREPDTARVQKLSIQNGQQNQADEIVTEIADSPHWWGLREIFIGHGYEISAVAAERLFQAKHLHQLTRLEAMGSGWPSDTLLGLNNFTELRSLRIQDSSLSDVAAIRLAYLPGLANLRQIDLTGNAVGGAGCTALMTSPHLKSLTALDLTRNEVRGLDKEALANAPAGGLRILGLQECRLTTADIAAISTSPRVSELMYLAICENQLPEKAIARMTKGFGNHAPAVLYLMDSEIGDEAVEAIANWPAASQIDMLHLENNRLSTWAAKAIANCQHLKGLNHVCTGVKHAAGRTALKKAFGNRAHV